MKKKVFDMENNPMNLADVGFILSNIVPILEYMKTPEMKELASTNYAEYKGHMENKYKSFCDEYYLVFQQVISGEDLTPLLCMLSMINNIKKGKCTLEEAEASLGNELTRNFVNFNNKK